MSPTFEHKLDPLQTEEAVFIVGLYCISGPLAVLTLIDHWTFPLGTDLNVYNCNYTAALQ